MKTVKVILALCLASLLIACSGVYSTDGYHGGYAYVATEVASIFNTNAMVTRSLNFSLYEMRGGFRGGGGF